MTQKDNRARPIYETDDSRAAQAALAERIAEIYSWQLHPLPYSYRWDYQIHSGDDALGFLELKNRTTALKDKNHFWISAAKIQSGVQMLSFMSSIVASAALFLGVRAPDGDFMYKYSSIHKLGWSYGGRANPRDGGDSEPMILIPTSLFWRL